MGIDSERARTSLFHKWSSPTTQIFNYSSSGWRLQSLQASLVFLKLICYFHPTIPAIEKKNMALSASRARSFMRDYLQRSGGDAKERSDNVDIALAVIISLQTSNEQCIRLRSKSAALSGWKQFASRQKHMPFAAESVGKSAIVDVLKAVIESTLLSTSGPDIFMFQVRKVLGIVYDNNQNA